MTLGNFRSAAFGVLKDGKPLKLYSSSIKEWTSILHLTSERVANARPRGQ